MTDAKGVVESICKLGRHALRVQALVHSLLVEQTRSATALSAEVG